MKNNYSRLKWVALIILGGVLFFLSQSVIAATAKSSMFQEQEISGIVSDQNGIPIPGVTIRVKNTNRGVVTNLDGEYEITAPTNGTLVFSYIGYKKQEVAIDRREEINIQLEEDVAALGEVQINAGYYNTTKRESTGNISRITAEEIELQPVVSPIQALQGRMAGVEITPGGSNPGTASTIRIRGTNSLREEGNLPLYIIDGVPINSTPIETNSIIGSVGLDPLNNLNVSNIASIEVLKDADATAIYGSRGANGVVLITTKTGKQRGTGLEARFFTGAGTVPNRLDLLNTQQYLEMRRVAFENDGVEPTQYNAYDLVLWDQDRYTDWQDFLYGGTSETTNANLTFSGGNDNTTFRLGSSYFKQGTVYPGDYNYNKVTGDFSLNHRSANNKLAINLSVNYGVDVNNLVGNLSLNSSVSRLPPNAPEIFNSDGSLNWEDWALAGLNNPLEGNFNTSETKTNNLISNASLAYELFDGLRLKTNLGYTYYNSEELWLQPSRSYSPDDGFPNISTHSSSTRKSWIIEPQLIYDLAFSKFNLNVIVGATFQENTGNRIRFQGSGYASEAIIGNIAAAEDILNASNTNSVYRYAALFSRIGINWDRKYYLNLTGRRDGSSRFGPTKRFSNFGAVGASWIFSEEKFIADNFSFLSFGKIRGSYGITGSDQIGDYGFLDAYEATVGPGGLYPTALSNPHYSWETNKKLEVGLELGFLKNQLQVSLSRYRNRSSNQLVGYALPYITGFNSVQANLPATVENTGWEIEANSRNFSNKNFQWETSFNLTFPKNELVSYPNIEQSSYANTYRVGQPLNISLLYDYTGLDPDTGFYTVRDVNEDGSIDYEDRINIQDLNREFYGGINNNLTYKNFSLQFLWQFVKQQGSHTLFDTGRDSNPIDKVLTSDRYQQFSQSSQASNAFRNVINTAFPLQDASYLRLKTLSFGYNLPETILGKSGIKNFRIFLHGQNLLTITPYDGLDPDEAVAGSGFSNLRIISAGIQINL
jgi:TonB-linked SusC/RagA family outer membrane protein